METKVGETKFYEERVYQQGSTLEREQKWKT